VREICSARKILLVFDEVQTGMGRLGTLWGYQSFGIEPDMMALAKALGGGIPFGAVLAKNEIADCLKTGDHGNTVGGSPLAAKLGLTVFNELLKPGFFEAVCVRANLLQKGLKKIQSQYPALITKVRGMGMIQGLTLTVEVPPVINLCRQKGLLACKAGSNVLRFLPPLNTKPSIIKNALAILSEVFHEISEKGSV
jgi:acetylornithine/succinyldiaminopimelate/putrescine aminotransferase